MVKARTSLRDGDTMGRMRRVLSSTQTPASRRYNGTSRLLFSPAISSTYGASVRRDTGNAPAAAPIGPRGMAAVDLARDRPGCRSRTGFENHETFARAFRARFGVTPSAF